MRDEQRELLESILDEQRQQLLDCERSAETETDYQSKELFTGYQRQLNENIQGLEALVKNLDYVQLDLPSLPAQPGTNPDTPLNPSPGALKPHPGLVLADTYRLEKILGKGGMGEVWLATHLLLNEPRAIKLVLDARAADTASRERFIREEARHALRLIHSNVVRVHDLGQQQQTPYIVMEYVSSGPEGSDLKTLLKARGKLSLEDTARLLDQIAAGLEAAHKLGLAHCDLKPANILITENGEAKISDFGLVKDLSANGGQSSSGVMGTPLYMSPEQIRGEVGIPSDIYSLGVILYELLLGRPPFTGNSRAVLVQHATLTPISPHLADPYITPAVSGVILKALAKKPEERYGSALQLATAFREALQSEDGGIGQIPDNLPPSSNRFVGREREVAELAGLLKQPDVRFVCLTGVAGTGKTRLSFEVAREVKASFPDGVFLVALENTGSQEHLITEIAQTLGLKETGGQSLLEAIRNFLKDKRLLLLLDNFEQLSPCSPVLEELLGEAAGTKFLVTSRNALRIAGEIEYPVEPLGLPEIQGSKLNAEALLESPAVALFVERAREIKKNFGLNQENAGAVAEVCLKLDGLPLAIELAAARTKLLTPRQILDRLGDRFKLLTTGTLDLPARQQTLRAAIDWSYELLDPAEKRLLARLAIFAGGCSVEAAERVCNARNDLEIEVLDGLESLDNKSLVKEQQAGNGQTRCLMLQSIREYALEKLESNGEAAELRELHAGYFIALAEANEPKLKGSHQQASLEILDAENDNLRQVVAWAIKEGKTETAARLAGSIWRYWYARSYLTEGRGYLEQILALPGSISPANKAKVLNAAGFIVHILGDYPAAAGYYNAAVKIASDYGNKEGVSSILLNLGRLADHMGQYDVAETYFKRSLELARETNDAWNGAASLNNLGNIASNRGDYDTAGQYYQEGLDLVRTTGDIMYIASSLNNLGNIAAHRGDLETARKYFLESLVLRREAGEKVGIAYALMNLGALAYLQEDYPLALDYYLQALELVREVGEKFGIAMILTNLGLLAYRQENYYEALQYFRESLELKKMLSDRYGIAVALCGLAAISARLAARHSSARQMRHATRLFGAMAALMSSINGALQPSESVIYDAVTAEARSFLGEEAYNESFAAGQVMPLGEAIASALEELPNTRPSATPYPVTRSGSSE